MRPLSDFAMGVKGVTPKLLRVTSLYLWTKGIKSECHGLSPRFRVQARGRF